MLIDDLDLIFYNYAIAALIFNVPGYLYIQEFGNEYVIILKFAKFHIKISWPQMLLYVLIFDPFLLIY